MRRNNRIRMLCGLMALLMLPFYGCARGDADGTQPTSGKTNLSFGGIVCMEYSRYSGICPETDKQVTNAAAMLIHNSSPDFLEYATIEATVGKEKGTFRVTGLPPGAMVWVLEQSGLTVAEGETFEASQCEDFYYNTGAVMSTDKLKVDINGNTLTVTNRTDKTLENVALYYKTVGKDGIYLGGRSFLLSFGNLPPGESASKAAGHFGPDSKIVRYSFQESG